MHINSVISTLNQLGIGPRAGLVIDKDTAWSALLEGIRSLLRMPVVHLPSRQDAL